jgi:hypothetical protein
VSKARIAEHREFARDLAVELEATLDRRFPCKAVAIGFVHQIVLYCQFQVMCRFRLAAGRQFT